MFAFWRASTIYQQHGEAYTAECRRLRHSPGREDDVGAPMEHQDQGRLLGSRNLAGAQPDGIQAAVPGVLLLQQGCRVRVAPMMPGARGASPQADSPCLRLPALPVSEVAASATAS